MKICKSALVYTASLVLLIANQVVAQEVEPATINGEQGFVLCGKQLKKGGAYRRVRFAKSCPPSWREISDVGSTQGTAGAQGPKGDTGAQGPAGAQGPQGPRGAFSIVGCQLKNAVESFSLENGIQNPSIVGNYNILSANLSCDSPNQLNSILVHSSYKLNVGYLANHNSTLTLVNNTAGIHTVTEHNISYFKKLTSDGSIQVVPSGVSIRSEINLDLLKKFRVLKNSKDAIAGIELTGYCCPLQ